MEFLTVNDVTTAFQTDGPRDAPVVVLTHGLGMNMSMWDDVIPMLPTDLRILRFDIRGHGHSSAPPPPYAMGALVRDTERLLDHLHIRDCVFVGYDIGGLIAQGLAVKRLDQIRALVLSHTAAKIGYGPKWQDHIDRVRAGGIAAISKTVMTQKTASKCPADLRDHWQAVLEQTVTDGYCGCAAAIAGSDFYTPTASLRLPTLAIAGANDRVVPADMVRETAELIPGAEIHVMRDGGHLGPAEAPAVYAERLNEFLIASGQSQL